MAGDEFSRGKLSRPGRGPFDHPAPGRYLLWMETPTQNAILLRLRDLSQLFNSMDPSPFIERDLDADAEEFIVSWARELPAGRALDLIIHLSTPAGPERLAGVENAVRSYFASRAEIKRRELGQLMRRGRLSLGVGLLFLVGCLVLAHFVAPAGGDTATDNVREGLTNGGWVAMWRHRSRSTFTIGGLPMGAAPEQERLARVRIVAARGSLDGPGNSARGKRASPPAAAAWKPAVPAAGGRRRQSSQAGRVDHDWLDLLAIPLYR